MSAVQPLSPSESLEFALEAARYWLVDEQDLEDAFEQSSVWVVNAVNDLYPAYYGAMSPFASFWIDCDLPL